MSYTPYIYFCKISICVPVCDGKKLVTTVIQELMHTISYFTFSAILTWTYQNLMKKNQKLPLVNHFFQNFCDSQIPATIAWNHIKFYIQAAYCKTQHWLNLSTHSSLGGCCYFSLFLLIFDRNFPLCYEWIFCQIWILWKHTL